LDFVAVRRAEMIRNQLKGHDEVRPEAENRQDKRSRDERTTGRLKMRRPAVKQLYPKLSNPKLK
jgi:hypothetical protein